jgi:glucose-fructose oxidoreductase
MPRKQVRYAVVGLGHIAQVAVLPAFGNARRNSRLAALVSGDPVKRGELSRQYRVERAYSYEQYDEVLASGEIDAVYIALPNSLHAEYAIRAAQAGVHVLVEKPMAVTAEQCERMAKAARDAGVKLMVAYRLHFERANLEAIEVARSGRIGEPRVFSSTFTMPVVPGNIRARKSLGGGTLYDIGIYCINAARGLFRDEPVEVRATAAGTVGEVEEAVSATLRFPGERVAAFTCSFGAADVSEYRIVGTKGDLALEPAYEYAMALQHRLTLDGERKERRFAKRDQFAPELLYFSDCVLKDRAPEPSGEEGLQDVRIVQAIYESADTGKAVALPRFTRRQRPTGRQRITRPGVKKPRLVKVESASGD